MLTMPAPCGRNQQEEDALIRYRPLIERSLARYRTNPKIDLEALRTYARLGVVDAVRSYDPNREGGASFLTHVFNRVRFWVQHGVRDGDPELIRVPRTVKEGAREGYKPQYLSYSGVDQASGYGSFDASAAASVDGEDNRCESNMLLARALSEALTDERERMAIEMRYLDGCELKEVQAYFDLTRGQAQKLIARALKRLREYCVSQGLSAELLTPETLPRAVAAATEAWEE